MDARSLFPVVRDLAAVDPSLRPADLVHRVVEAADNGGRQTSKVDLR